MKDTLYKSFSIKSLALYFVTLILVSVVFHNHFVGWHWVLWGAGATTFFFLGSWLFIEKTKDVNPRRFLLLVFAFALIIRVLYVWLMCYYYTVKTGMPLEYNASDSLNYHHNALQFGKIIESGRFHEFVNAVYSHRIAFSDLGYVISLACVYSVFGPNILIPHILHSLFSAYICVLAYRLSDRLFDNRTARVAAVISAFMPLFIYYCGLHLKEMDFAFFLILCIERIDFVMRERKNVVWNIFLILFSSLMIFSYRVTTGLCLFVSFFVYIFVNQHITRKARVTGVVVAATFLALFTFSGIGWEIKSTILFAFTNVDYNFQYLPGAFVLPLPKMTVDGNENLKLINGMVFVKNIIGFFAMYSLIIAYREKKLRDMSLLALVPITYLAIVSSIRFFSIERFYFPALPCLTVLAAYAIAHFEKKDMKWFNAYLAVLLAAIMFWSYYNVVTS